MKQSQPRHFDEKTPYNDAGESDRAISKGISKLFQQEGKEREETLSDIHHLVASRTRMRLQERPSRAIVTEARQKRRARFVEILGLGKSSLSD